VLICRSCGRDNPEGAAFCNSCGATLGTPSSSREVRKTVTVLFCDLSGSTELGEQTDPEALRAPITSPWPVQFKRSVVRLTLVVTVWPQVSA
jgi:hypothetical protein